MGRKIWCALSLFISLQACFALDLPSPPPPTDAQCAAGLNENAPRFDCFFEAQSSPSACTARGCCWAEAQGKPYCYLPEGYSLFEVVNSTHMRQKYRSPFPDDVNLLRVDSAVGDHMALRVVDAEQERWVPPYPKLNMNWNKVKPNPSYQLIQNTADGKLFKIVQNGKQRAVAEGSTLIYSDQLVQLTLDLNGTTLYGVGEHRSSFVLNDKWTRYTLWNHDGSPRENANLYGTQPFLLAVDETGNATGIYFHNSNAVEILLQPGPKVTFRSIGGILEFHIFLGPSPADVISQYTQLVGLPPMPPYWALGYQICRWGYGNALNVRIVWDRMIENKIPFDVQWNDIDYMRQNNDFTIDPDNFADLPNVVDDLHTAGLHYVAMLDPGVSGSEVVEYPPFTDGVNMDIFVKDSKGEIYFGKVWNPNSTVFPDFTHPRVLDYYSKQLTDFWGKIKFDALWLDMAEPSNFYDGTPNGCPSSKLETPPYVPNVVGGKLQSGTLCMTAQHAIGTHYNVHNIYGIAETDITRTAIEKIIGKRTFLISRANSAGLGRYSGHWSGDNDATWDEMRASVIELLTFSLYGVPLMGADICGFNNHADRELCNRWHQLGAFYTFSRNHNIIGAADQWPYSYDEEVTNSIRKVLELRYSLLPYLYTLFYDAQTSGSTVARPLFFEFPSDAEARKVEKAFLWGSALYIVPVLEAGATSVNAYLPDARWFDYVSGNEILNKDFVDLPAPFDTIPVLLRGGSIIQSQPPKMTTTQSREEAVSFTIAPDSNGKAAGKMYWDDGVSLDPVATGDYGLVDISLTDQTITTNVRQWNTEQLLVDTVSVLGVSSVSSATINGKPAKFLVLPNKVLIIELAFAKLSDKLEIAWK